MIPSVWIHPHKWDYTKECPDCSIYGLIKHNDDFWCPNCEKIIKKEDAITPDMFKEDATE